MDRNIQHSNYDWFQPSFSVINKVGNAGIVTARKRNFGQGNVFYTCLSFCPWGVGWFPTMHHRGICIQGGGLHPWRGFASREGFASRGSAYELCLQGVGHTSPWELEKWVVRILLECFLVVLLLKRIKSK